MRKVGNILVILIVIWSLSGIKVSGAASELLKYFRTDSAYVYSWNSVNSSWAPASVQLYGYSGGRITNLLAVDYTTRANQNKTEYLYNLAGQLEYEVNYYFDGIWKESTRNVYSYDEQNRISVIHIQKWINSDWADDRIQQNYVYDEYGRQTEFQAIYWRNGAWTSPTTDYSYYDPDGNLIRREAIYYTGRTDYQVIYTYNQFDVLSEAYSQYPGAVAGAWQNWWLVNCQYSNCIIKQSQIQYIGSGTQWIPGTRTEYFTYFRPELWTDGKVPVCRNGKTKYVDKNAVQNRLDHGDCLGPCPGTEGSSGVIKGSGVQMSKNIPFTIYPNPASERVTIKQKKNDAEISKVELMDMNGNLLRSESACNTGEVTIERGGLISGQYIVRIYGEQVYNLIVVFN